ncbi:hypothetical protein EOA60_34955 [Mesorhizobium sp. M1A.F.Ca.IN.020.06.1.1]|nr:hypothetical protein EOD29_11170 [Mesorhizobium sp. M1A.T.Ca.IN.004.03.1.1]RUV80800.1 hypothetical protein EOA51_32535 [Mesorhizobium sp. M1A.F.Ca.IN.020.32.1.1]RUW05444.1 hypothetical protein EOA46_28515 [Mesorhizobium sp. M1A.F.Ca.IN.022.05.2.1]RUW10686.1 hypothetical protein EOA60_34955 [Mesorhizobium sp. M1A.F.Ca.IN.020.06.1.1]RWI88769.1 MAG: hypothetical protein EOR21_27040 [Mesorhizobium sp.]
MATMKAPAAECSISPLAGEMSGRTEGGVKERQPRQSFQGTTAVQWAKWRTSRADRLAGQHPPLACRPSPPQGGRLATCRCPASHQAIP